MTIPTEVVAWMFFSVVLLAGFAIAAVCSIASKAMTGRAWMFERRPQEHARILHPDHEQWRSER